MKILMIGDFFQENLEYQENLVSETCVKLGHDVVFITSTFESVFDYIADKYNAGAGARTYVAKGIKIYRLPYRWNALNRVRRFSSISHILDTEQPDLIYAHDITLNFPEVIKYLDSHPNSRLVMDYHADYTNSGKNRFSRVVLHGVIRKYFLDRARPHISKIFPVVPAGFTFLRELYGVRDDEMELLPLAIDMHTARRVRAEQQGRALRELLGIGSDEFVVFTGGKFNPLKRTELVVEAVSSLKHASVHLIIVGEGEKGHPQYSENLKAMFGAATNVHFVGWQDREGVFRCLNACDMAVFPASQSVLWQQAIGMGLPLLVGDMGGQDPSYLNLHDNVIILQPEMITVGRIADEIQKLAADPARRHSMQRGADKFAEDYLDWDRVVARVLRFNASA